MNEGVGEGGRKERERRRVVVVVVKGRWKKGLGREVK